MSAVHRPPIRVVVVDDQPLVRMGLRTAAAIVAAAGESRAPHEAVAAVG